MARKSTPAYVGSNSGDDLRRTPRINTGCCLLKGLFARVLMREPDELFFRFDLDALGFDLFALGNRQRQHTILERRICFVGLETAW